jgi:hypothetical protein
LATPWPSKKPEAVFGKRLVEIDDADRRSSSNTWILKSEAVFASCLFVVEQIGCWRRLGSSNLKRSLLHVSSLSNSLAAGGDLEIFKSEAAFASCLFAVEQLGCWRRLGSSNLKQFSKATKPG